MRHCNTCENTNSASCDYCRQYSNYLQAEKPATLRDIVNALNELTKAIKDISDEKPNRSKILEEPEGEEPAKRDRYSSFYQG